MTLIVRPTAREDRDAWNSLYAGYAEFYRVSQTPQMRDTVWEWLHDPQHEVCGFVAEDAGTLVGLTHYRPFARPLSAATGGFLDDLFVAPDARGSGAAQALIDAVHDEGRKRGWTLVRWITAQDNYRARGLYDQLATQTQWITYDLKT